VVWRRPSGWNLPSAVLVVKSFEFEARIRARRALREKSTRLLPASITKAPLRPTRRKSLPSPLASLGADTDARAVAAPWAIGVAKGLSGPLLAACADSGSATTAAASSTSVTAPLRIESPMRRG